MNLAPEPDRGPAPLTAWLCRWQDQQLLVHATTIEGARLEARKHAGPSVAVSARLASTSEINEWSRP